MVRMVASSNGEGPFMRNSRCSALRMADVAYGGSRGRDGAACAAPSISSPSALGWEVVVREERIGREIRPLHRHHERGIGLLRVDHLLEERVLRRLICRDLVPAFEELAQDLRWRLQHLHA